MTALPRDRQGPRRPAGPLSRAWSRFTARTLGWARLTRLLPAWSGHRHDLRPPVACNPGARGLDRCSRRCGPGSPDRRRPHRPGPVPLPGQRRSFLFPRMPRPCGAVPAFPPKRTCVHLHHHRPRLGTGADPTLRQSRADTVNWHGVGSSQRISIVPAPDLRFRVVPAAADAPRHR